VSEINITEQERLHQLLCAYVLGEAQADERAEIEAALAKDAALREERARLESTIGLVQNALGKDETLSYRATSEVTHAASLLARGPDAPVHQMAWYRSSTLRMAASLAVVVGGGYLGWRSFVVEPAAQRAVNKNANTLASVSRDQSDYQGANPAGVPAFEPVAEEKLYAKREAASALAASAARAKDQSAKLPAEEALEEQESVRDALRQLGVADRSLLARRDALQAQDQAIDLDAAKLGWVAPEELGRFAKQAKPEGASVLTLSAGASPVDKPGLGLSNDLTPGDPFVVPSEGLPITDLNGFGQSAGDPSLSSGLPAGAGGGAYRGPQSGPTSPGPQSPSARPSAARAAELSKGVDERSRKAGEITASAGLPATEAVEETLGLYLPNSRVALEDKPEKLGEKLKGIGYVDGDDKAGRDFGLADFETLDELKKTGSYEYSLGSRFEREQRRNLTPQERQARIEEIITSCRPLPNEKPRDMFFRFWGDNPFEWTANDRLSTFSMDVDTASYTLARKYLVSGALPEKAQIRTEEFVNYFAPDIAPPKTEVFAISTELAPGRFVDRPDKWMLRVAVRGQEVAVGERTPLTLTFVIDVSGSMKEQQRLELVKNALRMLITQLDARDSVSIVAFSKESRLILPMTSAGQRALIESAIQPLSPDGGTNTEAGLRMGYEQALAALSKHTTNRVVLLTDGVANVGITDPDALVKQVENQRKAGIYLNTIGVGMNNHNDNLLEQLADKGDGLCNYVDDAAEVKHALVDNFLSTMVPIARDAKVQVEFDPAQVESYRLLGYENRAIADADFRNDKIDAGEINSGHQITALYEIVRTSSAPTVDAPLATVRVRYKLPYKDGVAGPGSDESSEIAKPVFAREAAGSFAATGHGYRRAVLAAQFAEFLRRSVHARGDSLQTLIDELQKLNSEGNDPQVAELRDMVLKSKQLLDSELANYGELQRRLDRLRESAWNRARLQSMQNELDRARLASLDLEIASLERELREEFDRRQVK
jgi:Ca-activated chloride channel family protein